MRPQAFALAFPLLELSPWKLAPSLTFFAWMSLSQEGVFPTTLLRIVFPSPFTCPSPNLPVVPILTIARFLFSLSTVLVPRAEEIRLLLLFIVWKSVRHTVGFWKCVWGEWLKLFNFAYLYLKNLPVVQKQPSNPIYACFKTRLFPHTSVARSLKSRY